MRKTSDIIIWDFSEGELTLRELLISVGIIAVMIVFGIYISAKIEESINQSNMKYYHAVQIEDNLSQLDHVINTNIPSAFIYSTYQAEGSVTYDDIEGQYMEVDYIKEKYVTKTRTETYTDSKGETHTRVETYQEWDRVDSGSRHVDYVIFCNKKFNFGDIALPNSQYIDTVYTGLSRDIRYVYHGVPVTTNGSLFIEIDNKSITDSRFFEGCTNQEALESLLEESRGRLWIFWICWIIFTVCIVVGFIYADNDWLTK